MNNPHYFVIVCQINRDGLRYMYMLIVVVVVESNWMTLQVDWKEAVAKWEENPSAYCNIAAGDIDLYSAATTAPTTGWCKMNFAVPGNGSNLISIPSHRIECIWRIYPLPVMATDELIHKPDERRIYERREQKKNCHDEQEIWAERCLLTTIWHSVL